MKNVSGVSSLGGTGRGCHGQPQTFERSVNPISTRGDRFCQPNDTGTTGFSDLRLDFLCKECKGCEIDDHNFSQEV